jgi:hypothetical protein
VGVGFEWEHHIKGIDTAFLPHELNRGEPGNTCAQHGSFLQVVDGPDDETLIFTDGDILLQRPFTHNEMSWLANIPANTVSACYNSGPHENLYVQGTMIQPIVDMSVVQKRYGSVLQRGMGWNVGVLVAKRSTYRKLYELYMLQYDEVCRYFHHAARQQWLMNLIIAENFQAQVMPYSFHANGHFGMPPGCIYDESGYLMYQNGGDPLMVAFRHKL